jgi:hypothetical protein
MITFSTILAIIGEKIAFFSKPMLWSNFAVVWAKNDFFRQIFRRKCF